MMDFYIQFAAIVRPTAHLIGRLKRLSAAGEFELMHMHLLTELCGDGALESTWSGCLSKALNRLMQLTDHILKIGYLAATHDWQR